MSFDHDGSPPVAAVFDAYGTIFDFGSAVRNRAQAIGASVATLIDTWRNKQLQYTWLRSLQHQYVNFEQVTAEALDYALDVVGIDDGALRKDLLALYLTLDPFPDAVRALKQLRNARIPCCILSNGTPGMLNAAVGAAGLAPLIDRVLSVESVGVYKPDPRVYRLAVDELGVAADQLVFVSANGWDAFAAAHFGMSTVWCNRTGQPAERLPATPTHQMTSLDTLASLIGVGPAGASAT